MSRRPEGPAERAAPPMSDAAVRAILSGAKTQLRVPINHRTAVFGSFPPLFWEHCRLDRARVDGRPEGGQYLHVPCHQGDAEDLERLDRVWAAKGERNGWRDIFPDCGPCEVCDRMGWAMCSSRLWPRIEVGDRLWIREVFSIENDIEAGPYDPPHKDGRPIRHHEDDANGTWWEQPHYRATDPAPELCIPGHDDPAPGWQSASRMPKWASRIALEVTARRVQRLQDISEEDAKAEGGSTFAEMFPGIAADQRLSTGEVAADSPYRSGFAAAWDDRKHGGTWKDNPWVVAFTFRRIAP